MSMPPHYKREDTGETSKGGDTGPNRIQESRALPPERWIMTALIQSAM